MVDQPFLGAACHWTLVTQELKVHLDTERWSGDFSKFNQLRHSASNSSCRNGKADASRCSLQIGRASQSDCIKISCTQAPSLFLTQIMPFETLLGI